MVSATRNLRPVTEGARLEHDLESFKLVDGDGGLFIIRFGRTGLTLFGGG
jgi:hypothetical protein